MVDKTILLNLLVAFMLVDTTKSSLTKYIRYGQSVNLTCVDASIEKVVWSLCSQNKRNNCQDRADFHPLNSTTQTRSHHGHEDSNLVLDVIADGSYRCDIFKIRALVPDTTIWNVFVVHVETGSESRGKDGLLSCFVLLRDTDYSVDVTWHRRHGDGRAVTELKDNDKYIMWHLRPSHQFILQVRNIATGVDVVEEFECRGVITKSDRTMLHFSERIRLRPPVDGNSVESQPPSVIITAGNPESQMQQASRSATPRRANASLLVTFLALFGVVIRALLD